MTNLPEEMLLDAEDFFKSDRNRFPKKITTIKHVSKEVLLNSLSEDMIEKREAKGKTVTKDDVIEIVSGVLESDYPSMNTTQILENFIQNGFDLPRMCRLGEKGMIRKLELQKETPLTPYQIDGLADSLEYDMKASAIHLNMRDKTNAVRLFDCATELGNGFRDESQKRGRKSEIIKPLHSVTNVIQPNTPKKKSKFTLV